MPCVIRLVCIATHPERELPPQWLASFDVDAHEGRGTMRSTRDRASAQRFPTAVEAVEAWRTQSKVRPLRPDGKPNRPLTAFTVEIEHDD